MNKILYLLLILLSANNLFAQVEAGFLSGIGYTNIITKNKPGVINNTYSEGLGYTMGGIVEYPIFQDHLFLKTGLFFSEKGAYFPFYNTLDGSILSKRRENVYYLESPIQIQFRFFPLFKLQAGLYNAVRLNMSPNEYGSYDNSYVHYDNRYDFGYIAGLNFEYKRFIFEANFLKSIIPLGRISRWDFDQNKLVLSDDTKFYNQNLFFKIGYKVLSHPANNK